MTMYPNYHCKITCLKQGEGKNDGDKNVIGYITKYYKYLFGHPERSTISLDIDNCRIIPSDVVDKLKAEFL